MALYRLLNVSVLSFGLLLTGCPDKGASHSPGDGHDHGAAPVHSEGDGHDHDTHKEGDGHDHGKR